MKRSVLANIKPDINITVDGNKYKIETITSMKTVVVEFTLDSPYETDPGTGTVGKYITSLEGGNTLVTKNADNGQVMAKRHFNDAGFVMTCYGPKVTATRNFKRA